MKKKILFIIITVFISLVICFVLGEVLARILVVPTDPIVADERNLIYQFDNELGWFPIKNSEKSFQGSRLINVKNNDLGFRDSNRGPKMKQRIAFIGDSYVWGYDVEQDERFTEKLQSKLPNWEIINMGVSGYGTDQEFLLLEKWFDYFQPDVVFLVSSYNDWDDNKTNVRYGGYYKPYFKHSNNRLRKYGTPVPKGKNYYSRQYPLLFKSRIIQILFNYTLPASVWFDDDPTIMIMNAIKNYVNAKGAKFILAFVNDEECLFCESNGIQSLSLVNSFFYETHGNHWTPQGHDFVCDKIYDFLIQENIVDTNSNRNASHNKTL